MDLSDIEGKSLIAQAQQGNQTAFNTLYVTYEKQIYGCIRARVSDDGDAQEIAQQTRIKVWEELQKYDSAIGSFRGFAKYWAGIMCKRVFNEKKSRGRREELLSEYHDLQSDESELEKAIPVEIYEELLRITFDVTSSPPHQLIAFGFCKLLASASPLGESTGKGVNQVQKAWPPRKVVTELSDTSLRELTKRLEKEYVEASLFPADDMHSDNGIHRYFTPLHETMGSTLSGVITDPHTRTTYVALLDYIVGDTTLRLYYTHTDDPSQDISHWLEAVKRRVWSTIKKQGTGFLLDMLQEAQRRQQEAKRKRVAR